MPEMISMRSSRNPVLKKPDDRCVSDRKIRGPAKHAKNDRQTILMTLRKAVISRDPSEMT